jgi:outer membrane immunogenic protein
MRSLKTFFAVLLSTTAILTVSAKADSLAELQARLEKAQKENLLLKAEKVERENLTMKAEALEQENAKMRAEAGKGASQSVAQAAPATAAPVKAKPANVAAASTHDEVSPRRSVNRALDNIPKDDPRREMTAKAVPVSSVEPVPQTQRSWTGIYAGINAGYGGNSIDTSTSTYAPAPGFNQVFVGTGTVGVGGPLAGGQVGYNHQFANNIVVGAESDLDYADVNNFNGARHNTQGFAIAGNGFYQGGSGTNYDRLGLNWLGTTRVRLGYAIGSFLPYATGGVAYGELTSSLLSTNAANYNFNCTGCSSTSGGISSGNSSTTQLGWTIGGGAEYKLADAWSIRGEYLYTSLGGITRNDTTIGTGNLIFFSQTTTGSYNLHQIRAGLNYHTDWLASKPAVVAKY